MNRQDAVDLADAIGRFLDGSDQSAQHVGEIEGIVIECCQDEDWFDDVSEALSLFVPGGGGYYIDERQVASRLRTAYALLSARIEEAE